MEKEKISQDKKKLHYPQPLSLELSGERLAAFMKLKTAWECSTGHQSNYYWPQPHKHGKHLALTNKMMTFWAMEMVCPSGYAYSHIYNSSAG
jgi:hypothetical protein